MLLKKVKDYFEKYSELKILFFFDGGNKYLEEIDNWKEDVVSLIKVDNSLFGLKYKLEFELVSVFLYFPYVQSSGKDRKLFPLIDLMVANRVLHIDPAEDFIQLYELKPYQQNLVKKYIVYLEKNLFRKH